MNLLQIFLPTDSVKGHADAKEQWAALKSMPIDDLADKLIKDIVNFTIHLAIAIVVFYVGRFVIKKIYSGVKKVMMHRQVDRSLLSFVLSLIKIVLYFILIVTVIGILGLETSSFLALFASAGVAIGMALSGTLQNFAGGVLILLLKPYRVGDYIEAQGFAGTVKEIQIFSTVILTFDNKSIIIPNGGLSTGSINNWNKEDYRRVDWTISLSYGDSIEVARKAILDMLLADDRVVKEFIEDHRLAHQAAAEEEAQKAETEVEVEEEEKPSRWAQLFHSHKKKVEKKIEETAEQHRARVEAYLPKVNRAPVVRLQTMADSSINLTVRAWTRTTDYWNVYFDMNEKFYNELPGFGLSFPFPQLDVHLPDSVVAQK